MTGPFSLSSPIAVRPWIQAGDRLRGDGLVACSGGGQRLTGCSDDVGGEGAISTVLIVVGELLVSGKATDVPIEIGRARNGVDIRGRIP